MQYFYRFTRTGPQTARAKQTVSRARQSTRVFADTTHLRFHPYCTTEYLTRCKPSYHYSMQLHDANLIVPPCETMPAATAAQH